MTALAYWPECLRRWAVPLLLAAGLAAAGCATNPATGKQSFTGFMSQEQERRIGAENHPKIVEQFGGEYNDPDLDRYVSSIGNLLAASSEMRNEQWTFTVLDSDIVNAFALPGGYVYVTRGLIQLAEDEAQLAAVIGHEIGHVTARHSAQRYSQGVLATIGIMAAGVMAGAPAADAASIFGQGFLASYSRSHEHEADALGVRYTSRIGYDPYGMSNFLRKMEAEKNLLAQIRGQTPPGASWLDTHPPTQERVVLAANEASKKNVPDKMNARDVFLSKIDGMIYGDSPAQGYRRGRVFSHPSLDLRFEVPPGFEMFNTPTQVIAFGPQQSIFSFDSARQRYSGPMTRYIRDVWAKNIQLGQLERIDLNGRDAATAAARLNTRNGPRDYRLVAVRWDQGQIYRMIFLTQPGVTGRLSQDFRRTTYSLRSLTSRERANLQPYRIGIHTVRRGETIESIARRMPFDTFAVERFRVLNGLGPNDRLQPGRKVKTVVGRRTG